MKKIRIAIIISLGVLLIGGLAYNSINASLNDKGKMEELGLLEHEQYEERSSNKVNRDSSMYRMALKGAASDETVTGDEVYEVGNDVVITLDEVSRAQFIFEQQGDNSEVAHDKAIEYMEEFNAMYVEAIEKGFDVSDSELKEYIKDLKSSIENSKNIDEIKKEIEQFDSEEEFWLYQEKVYKKKLPVQKYVASLEKEYNEGIKQNISEEENTILWNKKLEKIRKQACKKQQYRQIKKKKDIDLKFKYNK